MADKESWWSYHRERWNLTKFVLRCISLVVVLILIGVSAADGSSYYSMNQSDWWFILPIALLTIIVDFVELLCVALLKRNPGIPPGWHIGFELALLGGNLVAVIFISSTIPSSDGYPYSYPESGIDIYFKVVLTAFLGLFIIVRFILFVIACVDTHRYHTAAQVEMIVQALRRQNLNDSSSAAAALSAFYPKENINIRNPVPLQQLPHMTHPAEDPSDDARFYPELPENQKFLADLPARIHKGA
ncbi:hypothetical protein F4802DRAFT_284878 [Xylaria palmicola]|nr:hypothetical protein F4802DRAFT_284878 [Xylaria palmicola]